MTVLGAADDLVLVIDTTDHPSVQVPVNRPISVDHDDQPTATPVHRTARADYIGGQPRL